MTCASCGNTNGEMWKNQRGETKCARCMILIRPWNPADYRAEWTRVNHPLTVIQHLLSKLAEECGEVIQEVGKIHRFGLEDRYPDILTSPTCREILARRQTEHAKSRGPRPAHRRGRRILD